MNACPICARILLDGLTDRLEWMRDADSTDDELDKARARWGVLQLLDDAGPGRIESALLLAAAERTRTPS